MVTASPGSPDATVLATEVVALLRERGETLATAESLTGGLLSAAVTSVPGSSAAYVGGLVTYATVLKQRLLDVPAEVIDSEGVVSAACAVAMARGAASRTGADWALATTGVAGPDLQEGHPAGTVHVGLAGPAAVLPQPAHRLLALPGGREEVRAGTVREALAMLRNALLGA